jgi:hypothetical protein
MLESRLESCFNNGACSFLIGILFGSYSSSSSGSLVRIMGGPLKSDGLPNSGVDRTIWG